MHLAIFVLNNQELLPKFLESLFKEGISGGTILESKGMVRKMMELEDDLFSMLKNILIEPEESNKTMLFCLRDDQKDAFTKVCNEVTGGLENPNTGILMYVPLGEVFGCFMKK